jgi:N-carbamoylputrescine amidase
MKRVLSPARAGSYTVGVMSTESNVIRVGLLQRAVASTRAETIEATVSAIVEAAERGAQLVCLQELFADPYFCQSEDPAVFDWAEPMDGPLAKRMAAVARQAKVSLLVPYFEKRAPGVFHNSSLIFDAQGQRVGHYRKMHIPDDPQFMEKYYFTPGDLGFMAVETDVGKVGPLICWDQWYPEAARLTAMQGARVLIYPTAIGWLPSEKEAEGAAQLDAWRTIQRSHAIANGVFVIAVNRVGKEGDPQTGIEFWGHSLVIDPMGRVICEGGEQEETIICDLDMGLLDETRKWWPFFRDRRIDAFSDLTKRWLEP